LWYNGSNAISYAKFYSRSHDAVIRVYDEAGNMIDTHEQAGELAAAAREQALRYKPDFELARNKPAIRARKDETFRQIDSENNKRAAHSCAAPARSDIRSAAERTGGTGDGLGGKGSGGGIGVGGVGLGGDGFGIGAGLCGITEGLSFRLLVFIWF